MFKQTSNLQCSCATLQKLLLTITFCCTCLPKMKEIRVSYHCTKTKLKPVAYFNLVLKIGDERYTHTTTNCVYSRKHEFMAINICQLKQLLNSKPFLMDKHTALKNRKLFGIISIGLAATFTKKFQQLALLAQRHSQFYMWFKVEMIAPCNKKNIHTTSATTNHWLSILSQVLTYYTTSSSNLTTSTKLKIIRLSPHF